MRYRQLRFRKENQGCKIPDASGIVKKTDYNAKITELENKMLTNSALSAAESKIPDNSSLVKKTD